MSKNFTRRMNETFYSRAFNASEQGKVMETALENKDNDTYDDVIPGGNATTDKLFALSVDEAHNPAYGFQDNTNWEYLRPSATREAEATDYAGSLFVGRLPEYLEWWLRSPGGKPGYAIAVEASSGEARFYGSKVFTEGLAGYGVRPAFACAGFADAGVLAPLLETLRMRILENGEDSAAGTLAGEVCRRLRAKSPLDVPAETFNRETENYCRESLRRAHFAEGAETARDLLGESAGADFMRNMDAAFDGNASPETLRALIAEMLRALETLRKKFSP